MSSVGFLPSFLHIFLQTILFTCPTSILWAIKWIVVFWVILRVIMKVWTHRQGLYMNTWIHEYLNMSKGKERWCERHINIKQYLIRVFNVCADNHSSFRTIFGENKQIFCNYFISQNVVLILAPTESNRRRFLQKVCQISHLSRINQY